MPFAQILCNFSPHNAMVFLAVVIPEVTEGKYSMEDDFETAEDLPARSGDKWMKRWDILNKACR